MPINNITYPIKLYITKKFIIKTMGSILLIFLLGISALTMAIESHDKIMIALSWFVIIAMSICLLIMPIVWVKRKPTITLDTLGVEFFRLPILSGRQYILWSDIATVELIENSYRTTKYWQVNFIPKNVQQKAIIRILTPMTYNDVILNEKEIFYLIEQSFFANQPHYKKIEMAPNGNGILPYFVVFIVVIVSIGFILTFK